MPFLEQAIGFSFKIELRHTSPLAIDHYPLYWGFLTEFRTPPLPARSQRRVLSSMSFGGFCEQVLPNNRCSSTKQYGFHFTLPSIGSAPPSTLAGRVAFQPDDSSLDTPLRISKTIAGSSEARPVKAIVGLFVFPGLPSTLLGLIAFLDGIQSAYHAFLERVQKRKRVL